MSLPGRCNRRSAGHSLRAEGDASANPQYAADTHRFGITSAAAPTITGAAALFRNWFLDFEGNHIDDPGIMYANLLLMGDGLVGLPTATYHRNGFDNLYGAGRLRLRRFDPAGLDGPAQWITNSVCVAHNQVYDIPLNDGDAFLPNAHYIKAVTWWYDPGHDQGLGHDHYVLKLIEDVCGGFGIVAEQDLSEDNRQRVFRYEEDVPGSKMDRPHPRRRRQQRRCRLRHGLEPSLLRDPVGRQPSRQPHPRDPHPARGRRRLT